jgi:hypothetical protein
MLNHILSDLVILTHFSFVLFVIIGGFLVIRWKRIAWLHIPAFLWAGLVEIAGFQCPLTPLESWLAERSGAGAYRTGFVEHHIIPILYPASLTRDLQVALGFFVLLVNLGIYGVLFRRTHRHRFLKANEKS